LRSYLTLISLAVLNTFAIITKYILTLPPIYFVYLILCSPKNLVINACGYNARWS
jgi:hypothetical protein